MLKDEPEVSVEEFARTTGLHSTATVPAGSLATANHFASAEARTVREGLRKTIYCAKIEKELTQFKRGTSTEERSPATKPGFFTVARGPVSIDAEHLTPTLISPAMFLYIKSEVEKVWIRPANNCVCLIRAGTGR